MFVFMIFYFSQDRSTGFRPSFNSAVETTTLQYSSKFLPFKEYTDIPFLRFLNVWNCFMFFINVGTKGHHAKQLWIHQRRSRIDTGWLWLQPWRPCHSLILSHRACAQGVPKSLVLTDSIAFACPRKPCVTGLFGNLPRWGGMKFRKWTGQRPRTWLSFNESESKPEAPYWTESVRIVPWAEQRRAVGRIWLGI